MLIGGVVYRVLVFAPVLESEPAEARPMMSLRERHRANQVLAASAVLTLAGGWVALTIQGADVAGVSFWEAFDHRGPVASALDATRFGREFGRGIDVTAGFTVIVAVAYAAAPYGRRIALGLLGIPAAVLGIWALAVPGLSGHAGDPGGGLLAVTLDAAHVTAAAVWAGGLLQLAWVDAPRHPRPARRPALGSPHGHRQALLDDRADQRRRRRADRPRARPERVLQRLRGVVDQLRADADRQVAAAGRAGGARLPKPAHADAVLDASAGR